MIENSKPKKQTPSQNRKTPSVKVTLIEGFLTGKNAYFKVLPISFSMFLTNQILLTYGVTNFQSHLTVLLGALLLLVFLFLTAGSVLSLIFTASVHQNKKCAFAIAWRLMLHSMPQALLAGVITFSFTAFGLMLFILPGFIAATLFSICIPILLFESKKAPEALKLSIKRTLTHFTYTAAILSVTWLLMFGSSLLISPVLNLLNLGENLNIGLGLLSSAGFTLEDLIQTLVIILIFPFIQGLIISLYFNLSRL